MLLPTSLIGSYCQPDWLIDREKLAGRFPNGYSFLPQLKDCTCNQISIETAQSGLDCSVLSELKGKKIILGVLELPSGRAREGAIIPEPACAVLSDKQVETPETVASRIRRALPYVEAQDIIVGPDCGLKYLPRERAFGKIKAMADGARIVRAEIDART